MKIRILSVVPQVLFPEGTSLQQDMLFVNSSLKLVSHSGTIKCRERVKEKNWYYISRVHLATFVYTIWIKSGIGGLLKNLINCGLIKSCWFWRGWSFRGKSYLPRALSDLENLEKSGIRCAVKEKLELSSHTCTYIIAYKSVLCLQYDILDMARLLLSCVIVKWLVNLSLSMDIRNANMY